MLDSLADSGIDPRKVPSAGNAFVVIIQISGRPANTGTHWAHSLVGPK